MQTQTQPIPRIDPVMVSERAASFGKRSIKGASKAAALRMAVSMMDLTTLEGKDSRAAVESLCRKAIVPLPDMPDVPSCAAVCVYPSMVPHARRYVEGSTVKVASVATAFPSGQSPIAIRLDETRWAVDHGADEIDMVISRGAFLAGHFTQVSDEIAAIKEACGAAHLKVILETGELVTLDHVRHASDLAMRAGADFIKTSTGKVQPAATMPVTLVMLQAIRDFYFETGRRIGMKPAGGIRTSKEAIAYLVMLAETLGDDWLTPDLYRFGASSLLNDVLMQIAKGTTGHYQAAHYFAVN